MCVQTQVHALMIHSNEKTIEDNMKRRKFLSNSLLATIVGVGAASGTFAAECPKLTDADYLAKKISFSDLEYKSNEVSGFTVIVSNIHSNHFGKDKPLIEEMRNGALYPISFAQGDFAIQLKQMTHGFVEMSLYKLVDDKAYELVATNVGNIECNQNATANFIASGVKLTVSKST
jgi:hypothetical protein